MSGKIAELFAVVGLRFRGLRELEKFDKTLKSTAKNIKNIVGNGKGGGSPVGKLGTSAGSAGWNAKIGAALSSITALAGTAMVSVAKATKFAMGVAEDAIGYRVTTGEPAENLSKYQRFFAKQPFAMAPAQTKAELIGISRALGNAEIFASFSEELARAGVRFGDTVDDAIQAIVKNIVTNSTLSERQKTAYLSRIGLSAQWKQLRSTENLGNSYLAENENEEVALAKTHLRKALDWTRGKAARVGFYGARALNETVEMVARNLKALRLDYAVEDQLERLAAHDRFRAFAEAEHLAPVSITQNNTINVQSTATADDVGDKVSEALINSLKYLSPIPAF